MVAAKNTKLDLYAIYINDPLKLLSILIIIFLFFILFKPTLLK